MAGDSQSIRTRAQLEAAARARIAEMLEAGESGALNEEIYRHLLKGLRQRGVQVGRDKPRLSGVPGP